MDVKRVFLAERHAIIRLGLGQLIVGTPGLTVCGEASAVGQAFGLVQQLRPDLLITALTFADGTGLELIKNVRAAMPNLPILVLSFHDELLYGELVMNLGAAGFVSKDQPLENFLAAIRNVLEGKLHMSPPLAQRLLERRLGRDKPKRGSPLECLSPREFDVFRMIGEWKTAREIAAELRLSVRTVEYYRDQLRKKLHASSTLELLRYAVEFRAMCSKKPLS